MAGSTRVSQFSDHSQWKQWWRRSPNTWCSKKILLLLAWQFLFVFSWILLTLYVDDLVLSISMFLSSTFAPLIGWLADVRFGRYKVMNFGFIVSFPASILYYMAFFTSEGSSHSTVLLSLATCLVGFGYACMSAAMLPFLTDQIIGATSDELSAVVRWYRWGQYLGISLPNILIMYCSTSNLDDILDKSSLLIFAVPLAVIIISDCLCQQWLDRTHKVTNPIKLIIQVLNYTRKHRYPERRSAFTYIDEEQPKRIDYGKEKFGGPFTEEEVEDVKTFLRLIPLVICLTLNVIILLIHPVIYVFNNNESILFLNDAIVSWLFPVLLIPFYQLVLHRYLQNISLSMLQCIGAGLFVCILGHILLLAIGLVGVTVADDVQRYLSCTALAPNATNPGDYMEWYWKLGPCILYDIGKIVVRVLRWEFIIAQSPDKMKGLVFGISMAFDGFVMLVSTFLLPFTLCYDLSISLVLVVLFVVFLVLSKRYTLRERNREINIQAIVEEHYERYMDQEEEYRKIIDNTMTQ